MYSMPLSPQRRRRALLAHQLRQQGLSLRRIAERLQVSHTVVYNDLRALETQRPRIAQALADDKLLDHIQRLELRLDRLLGERPLSQLENYTVRDGADREPQRLSEALPPNQIARFIEIHERAIRSALTEYRITLQDFRASAHNRLEDAEDEADYPDDELTDGKIPLVTANQRLTKVDSRRRGQAAPQPQGPVKDREIANPAVPTEPLSTPVVNPNRQQRRQAERNARKRAKSGRDPT